MEKVLEQSEELQYKINHNSMASVQIEEKMVHRFNNEQLKLMQSFEETIN